MRNYIKFVFAFVTDSSLSTPGQLLDWFYGRDQKEANDAVIGYQQAWIGPQYGYGTAIAYVTMNKNVMWIYLNGTKAMGSPLELAMRGTLRDRTEMMVIDVSPRKTWSYGD